MFGFLRRSAAQPATAAIRQALVQNGLPPGMDPASLADLDAHPDLVLGSGHVEQHGAVVLTRRDIAPSVPAVLREPADRATHADDEQYVFSESQEVHP